MTWSIYKPQRFRPLKEDVFLLLIITTTITKSQFTNNDNPHSKRKKTTTIKKRWRVLFWMLPACIMYIHHVLKVQSIWFEPMQYRYIKGDYFFKSLIMVQYELYFRYKFANEKLKRTARYYSSHWRTWAAVNIQLAWRRYKSRDQTMDIQRTDPGEDSDRRLRRYAAMFMSLRPHDHLE